MLAAVSPSPAKRKIFNKTNYGWVIRVGKYRLRYFGKNSATVQQGGKPWLAYFGGEEPITFNLPGERLVDKIAAAWREGAPLLSTGRYGLSFGLKSISINFPETRVSYAGCLSVGLLKAPARGAFVMAGRGAPDSGQIRAAVKYLPGSKCDGPINLRWGIFAPAKAEGR